MCIIQSQTFNVILKQMNLMTYKSDTKFYLLVAPLFQSCLHHHQQTLHAENKNILIFCFCLEYLLSTSCHQYMYCRKLSCPFTQEKDFKFHHKYSLFRVLFNLHFKKLQIDKLLKNYETADLSIMIHNAELTLYYLLSF